MTKFSRRDFLKFTSAFLAFIPAIRNLLALETPIEDSKLYPTELQDPTPPPLTDEDLNGTPLKEHFLACVRAVRAQYRSDKDTAYTCRGAVIDIFDNLGIQVEDRSLPGFSFEASWNGGGLVSIRRPRYPACERKPEIQALLTGAQGTSGALISVRSARNTTPLEQCPDAPELCAPAVEKIE